MKKKRCNKRLIMYEVKNILGNPFVYLFGIFFPIMMLFLITKGLSTDVPASMIAQTNTSVFLTMSMIIPMAVMLLGYSANYAQELEKEIPLRMQLFGFSGKTAILAKIIAQFGVLTVGFALYTAVAYAVLEMQLPKLSSGISFVVCVYLISGIMFALAHGVSTIVKKFGPTYAIMMAFYFGIMILCGMMGVTVDMFPDVMQKLAALLPMSYICSDFIDFWVEGSYNFVPLIQSLLFFGAFSGIILLLALRREKRNS